MISLVIPVMNEEDNVKPLAQQISTALAYLLERALKADFALVKAWKGDRWGNLIYRKTARNFNPLMATAARVTIAEAEQIVELGALDPEAIVTQGIYVQRIIQGPHYHKRIERRKVRKRA